MLMSNFKSLVLAALSIFCFKTPILAFAAVDQTNEEDNYLEEEICFDEESYEIKQEAGLADIADRTKYESKHAQSLEQKELCNYIELHLLEVETSFEKIRNCPSGKLITKMIADQKKDLSLKELHAIFIDHFWSLELLHELISNRLAMLKVMAEDIQQRMSNSSEDKVLLMPLTAKLDSLCQRGQGMAYTVNEIANRVYQWDVLSTHAW
ncbi:MAG: hypothetical protein AB7F19_02845 [Candidatus Babeliales bacterium]